MTISQKKLSQTLGEYDFAMVAASYGANGSRAVMARAITNLPTPELDRLRPLIAAAIKDAVQRTTKEITDLGIVLDEPHPLRVRASLDDPGSYFCKADRVRP